MAARYVPARRGPTWAFLCRDCQPEDPAGWQMEPGARHYELTCCECGCPANLAPPPQLALGLAA